MQNHVAIFYFCALGVLDIVDAQNIKSDHFTFCVWSIVHRITSALTNSVFLVSLVRLGLHLCIYASVCRILTAIISDTKWLFSEGLALLQVVIASL